MRVSQAGGKKITLADLAKQAECTYPAAHQLMNDPPTALWIVRPIGDVDAETMVLHQKGLRHLLDVMREPEQDNKGKWNYKLALLKLEIFKYVDARLNHPITHVCDRCRDPIENK